MVVTFRHSLLLGFAAASLATPTSAKGRFMPLFNGNDLEGWAAVDAAHAEGPIALR